ncbi:MAG: hypothetical protein LBD20_07995 [Spirochaetaceae bacterium]|nr:hypothetical protein [Spirochaetaceae bacterium]
MKFALKPNRCVFWVLLAGLAVSQAAAQDTYDPKQPVNNSEFYVKQVTFDKIYRAPQGYIIQFRKGVLADQKVRIALPDSWFDKAKQTKNEDGTTTHTKGEIFQIGTGTLWPYLVVYYKAGEIDHVRLFISRVPTHPTWGHALNSPAVEKLFAEAENWKL